MPFSNRTRRRDAGFTLVELLVVIGIIALLVGILVPVVATMRRKSHAANTQNVVNQLAGAIERYYQDFNAYPGPVADDSLRRSANQTGIGSITASGGGGFDTGAPYNDIRNLTGAENLMLGLMGGLVAPPNANAPLTYDAATVGQGPMSLNTANPKRYAAYVDQNMIGWHQGPNGKTGHFSDDVGHADDTLVPEFRDAFPGEELPILYLRCKRGVPQLPNTTSQSATVNNVITDVPDPTTTARGRYDLSSIIGYTGANIGVGKGVKSSEFVGAGNQAFMHGLRGVTYSANPTLDRNTQYPYDAYPYFHNPSVPNSPRNKDGYILISAGIDRVWGTDDDICSFGAVKP